MLTANVPMVFSFDTLTVQYAVHIERKRLGGRGGSSFDTLTVQYVLHIERKRLGGRGSEGARKGENSCMLHNKKIHMYTGVGAAQS